MHRLPRRTEGRLSSFQTVQIVNLPFGQLHVLECFEFRVLSLAVAGGSLAQLSGGISFEVYRPNVPFHKLTLNTIEITQSLSGSKYAASDTRLRLVPEGYFPGRWVA